ncbi:excisionase family DNA-binding protein [bacterium]|nr:excisionase family DNA-binding protein [bacterium]MBU1024686.1 excisionase family DNA-binding protein [bacterium]
MAQTKEHRYMTITEAARLLNVNRFSIYRFIESGSIRAIKYGIKTSPYRLERSDVMELLKNGNAGNGKARNGKTE